MSLHDFIKTTFKWYWHYLLLLYTKALSKQAYSFKASLYLQQLSAIVAQLVVYVSFSSLLPPHLTLLSMPPFLCFKLLPFWFFRFISFPIHLSYFKPHNRIKGFCTFLSLCPDCCYCCLLFIKIDNSSDTALPKAVNVIVMLIVS